MFRSVHLFIVIFLSSRGGTLTAQPESGDGDVLHREETGRKESTSPRGESS